MIPEADPSMGAAHPDPTGPQSPARSKWASRMEFLFCGAAVTSSLGTITRFPYLCFRHGGVTFLIPYLFFMLVCGIPLFFLEMALGQYTSTTGPTAWKKICPMFQGIGFASQVLTFCLCIYHLMLGVWALIYFFYSFQSHLPWSTCENHWNTDRCQSRVGSYANPDSSWSFLNNVTNNEFNASEFDYYDHYQASSENEFWTNLVSRQGNYNSLGTIVPVVALCLLATWFIYYWLTFKGIKVIGKMAYFTVTASYLMLFIFFIRGVTLPGSGEGLKYFLWPGRVGLIDFNAWKDAAVSVLFTFLPSMGVVTTLGSYNQYNNNCFRDCMVLCLVNVISSLFAGMVVFSLLGFIAYDLALSIEEVTAPGAGLLYVVMPKALSLLPASNFWSVLFFLMIFLRVLEFQCVYVDSLATTIIDMLPRQLQRPGIRKLFVLAIAIICFLIGLLLTTEEGSHVFTVFDIYSGSEITICFIAFCEVIVISWVYGADRFFDNVQDMTGFRPWAVLKYCWLFITPAILGVLLSIGLDRTQYGLSIPGRLFGAVLMLTPLMCIPCHILVSLCRKTGGMTVSSTDLRQAFPHRPLLSMCGRVVHKGQPEPHVVEFISNDDKPTTADSAGV